MPGLRAAMRLLESDRLDEAAAALAPLASPAPEGVVARFRRAECLSRLGRHDEAVDEARRAAADAPDDPAPAVWLARCLAEAGRFDEAAAVAFPARHEDFVGPVRRGYEALARMATGSAEARAETSAAVLGSRHAPVLSLALREAERERLVRGPRAPDLHSVYAAEECRLEREELGRPAHDPPPFPRDRSAPSGAEALAGVRWLRLHWACGDFSDLVLSIRARSSPPDGIDECELEMLLALGRLDAAEALADRLARAAGKDASGELCVDRCRVAQLRGRPARPRDFDGFDDAVRRHASAIAWLDLGAALVEDRRPDARAEADRLSDPSHPEYVEAALISWTSRGATVPRA